MPDQPQIALKTQLDLPGAVHLTCPVEATATARLLDAAARSTPGTPVVVEGDEAAAHVREWLEGRPGWLILDDAPPGVAAVVPVALFARGPLPPGHWRGGVSPPSEAVPTGSGRGGELVRATTARAALAGTGRDEVDRLRAQLVEQRAWVVAEAERVRGSESWKVGHRLVRVLRLLTLRRDRGTDGLQRIVDRMSEPAER